MEILHLTKATHFTLEAWNSMWRHKKAFFILAFFSWILETAVEYWMGLRGLGETLFLSPLNKILQPFWAVTWLQYIITNKFSFKFQEYLNFNKRQGLYLTYAFILSLPAIGADYMVSKFNMTIWISLLVTLAWSLLLTRIMVIFPSIADGRPLSVAKASALTQPFWLSYLKSTSLCLFLTFLIAFLVKSIGGNLLYLLGWELSPFLSIAAINLFGIFGDAFSLTLAGLYYKKFILK